MQYTVGDIVKMYDTTRSAIYYRFNQKRMEVYMEKVQRGDGEVMAISAEGLKIIVDELNLKRRKEAEDSELKKEDPEKNSSISTETWLEMLDKKDKEIERLHGLLEQALRLNENNQVLLLKQKENTVEEDMPNDIEDQKYSTDKWQPLEKISLFDRIKAKFK